MVEIRYIKTGTQLRGESQGDELSIVGYAATWNQISEPLAGFRERLCPGCFARSLQRGGDVIATVNHDPSLLLGRLKNKTLTLAEDATGLRFRCVLPDTSVARDAYALIKRGDIADCSFAFQCTEDQWSEIPDPDDRSKRIALRTVIHANLLDTSIVANPAYSGTSVNTDTARLKPQR